MIVIDLLGDEDLIVTSENTTDLKKEEEASKYEEYKEYLRKKQSTTVQIVPVTPHVR